MLYKRLLTAILVSTIMFSSVVDFQALNEYEQDLLEEIKSKFDTLDDIYNEPDGCADQSRGFDGTEFLYDNLRSPMIYHLALEEYRNYNNFKSILLSCATPWATVTMLASLPYLNINGDVYLGTQIGTFIGEAHSGFNGVNRMEGQDDYITIYESNSYPVNDGFIEYEEPFIKIRKINEDWCIDWINCMTFTTSGVESTVFRYYILSIIKSFIYSENIIRGYIAFNQPENIYNKLNSVEISVTDLQVKHGFCTGSAYAFLTEYDKNGKEAALHKITVEIGENLSEKITDTIVESYGGYDPKSNPLTDDFRTLIFAAPAVLSLSILLLLTRIHKKDY